VPFLGAQYTRTKNISGYLAFAQDTLPSGKGDSLGINRDSLHLDSIASDSVKQKDPMLDGVVDYKAKDSLVMTADKWGFLYGEAEVIYKDGKVNKDIKLTGEKVYMNMDSNLVHATFGLDSVGKEFGFPILNDGGTDYESKTMKYNFKTRKGYITDLITTQGEGYILAGRAKKNEDDSYFIREGVYTTCDNHEHPHFYLALTKGKVKPGKNVVAGPAYLVIEDLPIPFIGLPFGFFPFSKKYSSGVIMPSYGDELDRGFNLRDGGYYFAINDNVDLSLTGDIYTKGSWGLKAQSTYRFRYKRSGSFSFNYLVNKYGDKEDADYSVQKDLSIQWTHTQDPKANMFRTLSASVNFSTSSYNRNSLDQRYNPRGNDNTKSSTVNLTQKIPNSPWSLSASMSVAQRSADSTIALTLPNLTITMSRIYPFKRKQAVGEEKWYEKIQMSYTGDFRNSITTKEDKLFKSNLQKDWNNAMQHSIPVSATFSVFNYLNITPAINYKERWYTRRIEKGYDPERGSEPVVIDTTYKFNRVYDFSFSLGFQTKLYGMYTPIFSKSTRIRHVFTPSISLNYAPDFGDPSWGFYKKIHYQDRNGNHQERLYSPYEGGMFGTAPNGPQGSISFSFENNLEMKIKSESDSTGFKKISLIDNLSLNTNYNMMADEFKWSDIAANIRLKFSKSFVVNIGAAFDPYIYRATEDGRGVRVDKLRISNGKGIGRLKSTGYSISPSINQDTFKKLFGKGGDDADKKNENDPSADMTDGENQGDEDGRKSLRGGQADDNQYDEDGYVKNEIKWNLGFNFSMNLAYNQNSFDTKKMEYKYRVTKNFGLNGSIQPTKNWNFNFNTTYDFDAKKIAYMTVNLTRNLHCWSISASVNPVGMYKSYYVTLRASSSMLQDLKYEQRGRSSTYDPNWD